MKWTLLALLSLSAVAGIVDKYPNFAALSQNEVQNQDYRIIVKELGAPVTIFAIHGGLIEPGSDEMAKALSEDHRNLYIFEGLKQEEPTGLHLTATHFDEPRALELAAKSESCVSVHGYLGNGSKAICVGGNDQRLAGHIVKTLKEASLGIDVIYPCKAFPATHPKNIVNRCLNKGVQLEISQGLWDEFIENSLLKNKVIQVLRNSLSNLNTLWPMQVQSIEQNTKLQKFHNC